RVAHTPLKTPTKVAEFLVDRVRAADERLAELRRRLAREAGEPLRRARRRMEISRRELQAAGRRLGALGERLAATGERLGRAGGELLRRHRQRAAHLAARAGWAAPRTVRDARRARRSRGERLAAAARLRLREAASGLEGRRRLCRELAPERVLARGFTITRSAAGEVLKSASGARPGERIETVWVDGARTSRVEES
ncbi:MAG: exodeoxyribonuclease VII large subunit, partial [Thermoanaerobaculia bacterium]|nr:exodeoxyribonuclease VII large subunit [Thermoanaerobaculia bacterium]